MIATVFIKQKTVLKQSCFLLVLNLRHLSSSVSRLCQSEEAVNGELGTETDKTLGLSSNSRQSASSLGKHSLRNIDLSYIKKGKCFPPEDNAAEDNVNIDLRKRSPVNVLISHMVHFKALKD
jgi:hypothetical protein